MPNVKDYEKVPMTVYLTKGQKKALNWIKAKSGIPAAEVIRRAIDKELLRHKIPKSLENEMILEVPVDDDTRKTAA